MDKVDSKAGATGVLLQKDMSRYDTTSGEMSGKYKRVEAANADFAAAVDAYKSAVEKLKKRKDQQSKQQAEAEKKGIEARAKKRGAGADKWARRASAALELVGKGPSRSRRRSARLLSMSCRGSSSK